MFERGKPTVFTWAIIIWFLGTMIVGGFRSGHYETPIFWVGLLALCVWQRQREKSRCQKEPSSFYYYIFQKRYPDNQRDSVALP